MAVVKIEERVTKEDLKRAREEYGDFIKVVVDINKRVMVIGGEWHADAEKMLLDSGSQQENIWGGSVDLTTRTIDVIALINIRPRQGNDSQEILDLKVKEKFIQIVEEKFNF